MTKVIERRIVTLDWYETEMTKTGFDSYGWVFDDDGHTMGNAWKVVEHIHLDKFGNPLKGVAEREVDA